MLLRAMLLAVFVAVLGETMAYGAAALARTIFHAHETIALRRGMTAAVAQAQAAAISGIIPAPSATCAQARTSGCALAVRTTIVAASAVPGPTPSTCPNADCTIYLQNNTHVDESRASYTIREEVVAGNGDAVATRSATVTFRTFAAPPYASLVGSIDRTLDSVSASGTGDDGGNAGIAPTLIHVQYLGSVSGRRISGDVWRAQDQRAATAALPWDN